MTSWTTLLPDFLLSIMGPPIQEDHWPGSHRLEWSWLLRSIAPFGLFREAIHTKVLIFSTLNTMRSP